MMKKATQEEAVAVTWVFWDMIMCPIPAGCDPRVVRPCIKRLLKRNGYCGPLTVTAFGKLGDVPTDMLRGVYSSGIALTNVPHANFMVISDQKACSDFTPLLLMLRYNPLQPFPYDSLETLILEDVGPPHLPDDDAAMARKDYLMRHNLLWTDVFHPPTLETPSGCRDIDWEAVKCVNETFVFWDINLCPVPSGCDASLVGPCIKRFLKKEGCSGPLTIIAIGVLTNVPIDILRKVYSSGIALHNVPYGLYPLILRPFYSNGYFP